MAVQAMLTDDYDPDYAIPDAPRAGRYHAPIIRIDEDGGKSGEMIVDYEVVAGTTRDQEGKVFRDYFHKTVKAMGRIHQLAMACGLVTAEQLKDMKARGATPEYEFARDCVGKHVCLDLYEEEYPPQSKSFRTKCGFGIYHIDDQKTKDIPKNMGMLAKAGITLVNSLPKGAAPKQNAAPPQPPQTPPTQQQVPSNNATADVPFDLTGVV